MADKDAGRADGHGISDAQRIVLANQVSILKLFKLVIKMGVPVDLPDDFLKHLAPPPTDNPAAVVKNLDKDVAALRSAWADKVRELHKRGKVAAAAAQNGGGSTSSQRPSRDSNGGITAASPPVATANTTPGSELKIKDLSPAAAVATKLKDVRLVPRPAPIFSVGGHGCDQQERGPIDPQPWIQYAPIMANVSTLIREEYQRMTQRQLKERIAELEAIVKDPSLDPGMKYRSERPPLGAALLQLRTLRALEIQRRLRAAVDAEGREVLEMNERQYKMLLKSHRNARIETARKDIAARAEQAAARARDVKAFRAEVMGEANSGTRELRVARNRGISRAHERLNRERNKLKDDDRSMRLEALKAHDFEAYQEMLRRQTGSLPAAGERYEAISKFLADTEAYLNRLAGKIASVKVSAEAATAATQAIVEARARGLSEEEVQAAARAAAAEAASGSEALRAAVEGAGDAQSRYYQLAHSNTEEITDQPTMLRPPGGAKLREYQIVGLQWMVSLYNNHLNGILADEMGLGKTVQVMALIAYLMEKKSNYGPHLIIVPNAVMVNWKSELQQWLPAARCVYYVGQKDERARKYVTEVQPLQFNVLVTTYEFIMRDRTKLSKIDWQYIIIDEAQRMKDRQSKLAKDLDRFTAARRLLLSGTPLQNDLQELWSLLNLLLPDVFDDKKIFSEWFGDHVGGGGDGNGDDWLEKEKRVVVIHRLHQILEPFMLRRQVEDVESKLPPKTAFTVRAPMSAHQSAVYSWVKATGTLRMDPCAPLVGKVRREWANLQNKCMELRKLCNHPLLSYPPPSWAVGPAIVRQCGKLVLLDRMLVKLKASGHRVLLFCTMTKLLDLLEVYLQWRQLPASAGGGCMQYLRIDGSTSLDDRESAIRQFNAPDSEAFIFLLSIRAAGRGLNLQSADTVVVYDPDPNPKNEEQAIARSHRIGQHKEVRVFHLEAVADAAQPTAEKPAAEAAGGGADGAPVADGDAAPAAAAPQPAEPAGPPRRLYADSIESIVRNSIQRIKIEMANEVIDAGRFDQQTSMEERRHTLEALLQDQDKNRSAYNEAPTAAELNKMLSRTPEETLLFEKMDAEDQWFEPSLPHEVPAWMRWTESDLRTAIESNAKQHKVDVEAEMAALTGIVLHHHHAAEAPKPTPKPAEKPVALAPAEPTMTTTTTRSAGGEGEEEEEVEMEDNDEEEEVLEQNLMTDDITEGPTEAGTSGALGGGDAPVDAGQLSGEVNTTNTMIRVQSTAGSGILATQSLAAEAPAEGHGEKLHGAQGEKRSAENALGDAAGEEGEEQQALKKRRTLSVHFEDAADDQPDDTAPQG